MAMFGNRRDYSKVPAPQFGAPQRDLSQVAAPDTSGVAMPEHKQSFFGEGGTGRAIVGNLADGVLQQFGQRPVYQPAMQHQRDLAEEARQRQQAFQQQLAKMQWQRDNPGPTSFERDLTAAGIDPNSEQGRSLYQQRVRNQADPLQSVKSYDPNTGRQGLQFFRPSEMTGGGGPISSGSGAAPPSTLPPDFDFGEGGPASAPGRFP